MELYKLMNGKKAYVYESNRETTGEPIITLEYKTEDGFTGDVFEILDLVKDSDRKVILDKINYIREENRERIFNQVY